MSFKSPVYIALSAPRFQHPHHEKKSNKEFFFVRTGLTFEISESNESDKSKNLDIHALINTQVIPI